MLKTSVKVCTLMVLLLVFLTGSALASWTRSGTIPTGVVYFDRETAYFNDDDNKLQAWYRIEYYRPTEAGVKTVISLVEVDMKKPQTYRLMEQHLTYVNETSKRLGYSEWLRVVPGSLIEGMANWYTKNLGLQDL